MLPEARILLHEVQSKWQELIPLVDKLQKYVENTSNLFNVTELVDIAFACRETEDATDTFMKRIRQVARDAQSRTSIAMETLNIDIVRTDYCSASPNPKTWFKVPYKRDQNPEKWDTIMRAIGVSELAATKDLVRIHAPGLMDYCAELIGEGGNPPAGINPKECTSVELNLRITRRKDT